MVGTRVRGQAKPKLPLEDGQMQCTTCHDPHLRETDPTKGAGKFLRLNRLQESAPTGGNFSEAGDIFCLACHDKGRPAVGAVGARQPAGGRRAVQHHRGDPARVPGQPAGVARGLPELPRHAHRAGPRRLLREGTDSPSTPKAGGNPAIEETCYQCHSRWPRAP